MILLFVFAVVLLGCAIAFSIIGVPTFLFALGAAPLLFIYALILASILWAVEINFVFGMFVFAVWIAISYLFQKQYKAFKHSTAQ